MYQVNLKVDSFDNEIAKLREDLGTLESCLADLDEENNLGKINFIKKFKSAVKSVASAVKKVVPQVDIAGSVKTAIKTGKMPKIDIAGAVKTSLKNTVSGIKDIQKKAGQFIKDNKNKIKDTLKKVGKVALITAIVAAVVALVVVSAGAIIPAITAMISSLGASIASAGTALTGAMGTGGTAGIKAILPKILKQLEPDKLKALLGNVLKLGKGKIDLTKIKAVVSSAQGVINKAKDVNESLKKVTNTDFGKIINGSATAGELKANVVASKSYVDNELTQTNNELKDFNKGVKEQQLKSLINMRRTGIVVDEGLTKAELDFVNKKSDILKDANGVVQIRVTDPEAEEKSIREKIEAEYIPLL